MFKKILSLALVVVMCVGVCFVFASCGDNDFKVGFIFLHDENSTYDKNFMDAAKAVQAELGLKDSQVLFKTNVPEGNECYEAAADLVDKGCDVVFADSFGHEPYMIQAAREFTDVQFCHATGTKAHTENLSNYHNAFASIYEGRYLAGVAAGMKLNEMIAAGTFTAADAKMGYVGAFPYAEVISGYTSFYLGAKSVCPTVTMDVRYTSSWYDVAAEQEAAINLISDNCKLISQHADSMGAPNACEARGIPNVSYNGSTVAACPNTFIVSSKINWAPYFKVMINGAKDGTAIPTDYTGTIATGSVELSTINDNAAADGTAAKLAEVKAQFEAGTLKVFNTDTFACKEVRAAGTLGESDFGQNIGAVLDANGKVSSYLADVNDAGDYIGETEVISDGYFHESQYRSAPYFDLRIVGINEKF